MFLTTQYLEEADELADLVGMIAAAGSSPGNGVAKAEVGSAHLEIELARGRTIAGRRGVGPVRPELPSKDRHLLVEVRAGAAGVAPVVRALDDAGLAVESLDLVEPTLDDVFVTGPASTSRATPNPGPQKAGAT